MAKPSSSTDAVIDIVVSAETVPLLPQHDSNQQPTTRRCFPILKYRLPVISEKGGIFMIVWNFLFILCASSTGSKVLDWKDSSTVVEFTVLSPLNIFVGLAADCWIGRYRIIKTAVYALLPAIVTKAVEPIITVKPDILPHLTIACISLSVACYQACAVQLLQTN